MATLKQQQYILGLCSKIGYSHEECLKIVSKHLERNVNSLSELTNEEVDVIIDELLLEIQEIEESQEWWPRHYLDS